MGPQSPFEICRDFNKIQDFREYNREKCTTRFMHVAIFRYSLLRFKLISNVN
jgi:hypothetical protein